MGGDGKGHCSHAGKPLHSMRRCRKTARHANADLECPSPAAARKARNLQNFFPFPWQEEEEEALQDDDVKEEDRKAEPVEDPDDLLDSCCCGRCCWREGWEKCSFFPFDIDLSWETAFLSSWHLLPARERQRIRQVSLADLSDKNFITEVHQSTHEVASTMGFKATSMS